MDQISDISDCIELSLSALGACLAKQPDGEALRLDGTSVRLRKSSSAKSIEESKITEQLPTHKIVKIVQNTWPCLNNLFSEVSAPRLKQNFGTATRCYMWHAWMAIFRSKPKATGSNSKRVQALKHSRVALRRGPILAGCILWMNSQVEMCPCHVCETQPGRFQSLIMTHIWPGKFWLDDHCATNSLF